MARVVKYNDITGTFDVFGLGFGLKMGRGMTGIKVAHKHIVPRREPH